MKTSIYIGLAGVAALLKVYVVASGLNMPNGVALKDGAIYRIEFR